MVGSGPAAKGQAIRGMPCCPAADSMQTISQQRASDVAEGLLGLSKISFSSLVSPSGSDIGIPVVQKCSNFSNGEKTAELEPEAKGSKRTYLQRWRKNITDRDSKEECSRLKALGLFGLEPWAGGLS